MAASGGAESPPREKLHLVVLGGWEEGSAEAYDDEARRWAPLIPLPDRRAFHASAVLFNMLYIAGGQDDKRTRLNTMLRYYPHPTKPKWIQCAKMKLPRFVFGLATLNRKLYAIGGLTDQGPYSVVEERPIDKVEVYDPGSNMWSSDVPALPMPARGVATACLGSQVYAVSGDMAARLQDNGKEWEIIPAPSMGTSHLAMVALGKHVYALGGIRRFHGVQKSSTGVERFDPDTKMWEKVAPLQVARHSIACEVLNGAIYACGGTNDEKKAVTTVEVYDPACDTWSFAPSMIRARGGATANVIKMVMKPPPTPA